MSDSSMRGEAGSRTKLAQANRVVANSTSHGTSAVKNPMGSPATAAHERARPR